MPHAQHILSYAQTLAGGGVERALLRLAQGWVVAGRRVTLVIGCVDGPLAGEVPPGLETVVLGSRRYRALFALPGIVSGRAPDVIFCPGNHYTSVAVWTRLRLGRRCPPIVSKVSNALVRGDHGAMADFWHSAWLRLQPRFIDRMVAMSPATAEATIIETRIPAARVTTIANPPAQRIAGATRVVLPPRYLLGVGRLAPQKRWDRLVAALPRLADARIPLIILGEGDARRALLAQAAALGIADRLLLPGHVADPLEAMAGAAVLALTSDFEGVPGVLREALSVGTPVVTTDSSPAVAEIVDHAALGTIVARDDPAGLVAALDRWIAPGALRPAPVSPPGADAAARYLALFDSLVRP